MSSISAIKNKLLGEHKLVFMFCMAVIIGPAIATLFTYDLTHYPDCNTYLGLAHFDFNQSAVRRYRILIPFAASSLNYLSCGVFSRFAPSYFAGDFCLPFSFFLVNTFLTAWFGQLIYRYCRAFGIDRLSSLTGTLVMLTCRYTVATAALPLVDSLFCAVVTLTLLGIKLKNTNMLLLAIFLGPFAKESFIFIAPLILFFSHISKKKLLLLFLLSGALVFTFRYLYDIYTLKPVISGLKGDLSHLYRLKYSLRKILSISVLIKIWMNVGLWLFVPLLALVTKRGWGRQLIGKLDHYLVYFMISVVFQMLLSGSFERMFYLAMPVICVIVAFAVCGLRTEYLPATFKKSE
jgi:hypothetical protein